MLSVPPTLATTPERPVPTQPDSIHTACSTVSPLSASPVDDADADGETDCAIVRRAASVPEHTTLTCTAAPGAHTRTYRPSRPAGSRVMRAAAAAESPRPASLTRAGWPHAAPCTNLIQGGLLHDTQKLLLVDLAVAVAVGLIDHLLQLLVGHILAELLGDALEVLERDLAGLVVVEEAEGLQDLLPRVLLAHLRGHHLQELIEVDRARAVLVDVRNHLFDLLLLRLEAERTHRHLQLLGVDGARTVGIKEVERLADLLLLLLGELGLATLALGAGWRRCTGRHGCAFL